MRHLNLPLLLFAAAFAPSALAAPPQDTHPDSSVPSTVSAHRMRGDAARRARRWSDAAAAYKTALEAARALPEEKRAAIAGELGLCELALSRYRDAATHLASTIEHWGALDFAQRSRFDRGLADAEEHVARVIIAVNPPDAEVLIDGKPVGPPARTYVIYVEPGSHTVRARLVGRHDDESSLRLPAGSSASVTLRLAEGAPHDPAPAAAPRLLDAGPLVPDAVGRDTDDGESPRTGEWTFGGISLVPLLAIGLTPVASAGASADVAWRFQTQLSLNLEGRFLASQTTSGGAAIRTLSGRPQLSVCGHGVIFSLCGLAGFGRLDVQKDPTIKKSEVQEPWSATFGVRPGVEWRFTELLALRGFLELHAVVGHPSVWIDGEKVWAAPPVAGILGVGLMLPFKHRRTNDKVVAGPDGSRRF